MPTSDTRDQAAVQSSAKKNSPGDVAHHSPDDGGLEGVPQSAGVVSLGGKGTADRSYVGDVIGTVPPDELLRVLRRGRSGAA